MIRSEILNATDTVVVPSGIHFIFFLQASAVDCLSECCGFTFRHMKPRFCCPDYIVLGDISELQHMAAARTPMLTLK